jgi:heme-degrading monooxygenase HmoA
VSAGYVYLWEFRTSTERRAEFERHYGAEGTWVQLFRRAPGYVGTELLGDVADPLRFVTIDRWVSAADYQSFRERFAGEYATLDALCAELTVTETLIGRFGEPER